MSVELDGEHDWRIGYQEAAVLAFILLALFLIDPSRSAGRTRDEA